MAGIRGLDKGVEAVCSLLWFPDRQCWAVEEYFDPRSNQFPTDRDRIFLVSGVVESIEEEKSRAWVTVSDRRIGGESTVSVKLKHFGPLGEAAPAAGSEVALDLTKFQGKWYGTTIHRLRPG
jgi:hypothetical protein